MGNRKSGAQPGDRAFLLRQGTGERGIVGSGYLSSEIYQDEHWEDPNKVANYVEVYWDSLVEDPLPLAYLKAAIPGESWRPQTSGTTIKPESADIVEQLWAAYQVELGNTSYPRRHAEDEIITIAERMLQAPPTCLSSRHKWLESEYNHFESRDAVTLQGFIELVNDAVYEIITSGGEADGAESVK